MDIPKVYIEKANYDYDNLRPILFKMLDSLGANKLKKGANVLIKPNLLLPANPKKAILTNPIFLKVIVDYLIEKECKIKIGDSPAIGSLEKILTKGGFKEIFKDLDVEFFLFKETVKVDIGEPFGVIDLAKEPVETDFVINLPKLKTHTQMLLTLGVKNLFGCVVGYKKPEWHFKAGTDKDLFAKLLVQIYKLVNPSITIIDGILALEGQGPGIGGTPRELNVIIGSNNTVAADICVCNMLGIEPKKLFTNNQAINLGIASEEIEIIGTFSKVKNFKIPSLDPLMSRWKILSGIMRRHLLQRPVVNKKECILCKECVKYCPPKAIDVKKENLVFNYDKCIRCYCCVEVCPKGALKSTETLPGMLLRKLLSLNK